MGLFKFDSLGIKSLSATVPHNIIKTRSLTSFFSEDAIEKFIAATGVEERRFIDKDKCASDLCYTSAVQIFEETDIKPADIDVLLFISQTPDYRTPGTSIILQNKLHLNKTTVVYDINMSCSGFLHGLLMAFAFLQLQQINNVMIMVGDTLSKVISPEDKSTGLLIGDAGITCVVGKGSQYGNSFFSMCTDGSNVSSVYIPGGGARMMSTPETRQKREYEDGSFRTLEQLVMNGPDVFSFAISELPKDIKKLLSFAGMTIEDVNLYAFHQANNFMTNYISKKVKAAPNKLLRSINKYGNTAGTSIPLCIVENRDMIKNDDLILMNAIGAGFAYGTAIINIADCKVLPLCEL